MANMHTTVAPSGNFFTGFFESIFNMLVSISQSNVRMQQVERLNAMSDGELAQRGIKREDIVRHVFRDSFHI